jgi:hypothetical protein
LVQSHPILGSSIPRRILGLQAVLDCITLKDETTIITVLHIAHLFYCNIILYIISNHISAFVPFWHVIKNSVTVEIGCIHLQPFVNISSHFTVIKELVNSLVLFQQAKQINLPWGVTLKHEVWHYTALIIHNSCSCSLRTYGLSTLLFGLRKQHFRCCWLHNHEKMEMVVCEWLWMQESKLYCNEGFKVMATWYKCMILLRDYVAKYWSFSAVDKMYLSL